MTFNKWLDTFIEEKGIQTDEIIEVEGPSGVNYILIGMILDAMKMTNSEEQRHLKSMLVKIDFLNGDVVDYIKHLAKAIAI